MARNEDTLIYALSKFVSIPSVSSCPDHREDCRQAAIWLTKCFAQLGASSKAVRLLPCTPLYFSNNYSNSCMWTKRRFITQSSSGASKARKALGENRASSFTGKQSRLPSVVITIRLTYDARTGTTTLFQRRHWAGKATHSS